LLSDSLIILFNMSCSLFCDYQWLWLCCGIDVDEAAIFTW
jgi:hypothetical protein